MRCICAWLPLSPLYPHTCRERPALRLCEVTPGIQSLRSSYTGLYLLTQSWTKSTKSTIFDSRFPGWKRRIRLCQTRMGSFSSPDFTRTSICDKCSCSTKITTHLDHISHCKTAFGTNRSNRWTYRVFIINTSRDEIWSNPEVWWNDARTIAGKGHLFNF